VLLPAACGAAACSGGFYRVELYRLRGQPRDEGDARSLEVDVGAWVVCGRLSERGTFEQRAERSAQHDAAHGLFGRMAALIVEFEPAQLLRPDGSAAGDRMLGPRGRASCYGPFEQGHTGGDEFLASGGSGRNAQPGPRGIGLLALEFPLNESAGPRKR